MDTRYLLDSNIIIYFLEGILTQNSYEIVAKAIAPKPILSIVSKIEVLSWASPNQHSHQVIQNFITASELLWLSNPIADRTISIRKNHKKIKLPDAIIAATAIVHNLTLLTRNESDFKTIEGLTWRNPFSA